MKRLNIIVTGGLVRLIDYIILKAYAQMKEERTIYSIFYLLKGKRSIQTVQDAHLFNLTSYYGIYKKISLHEYDVILQNLLDEQKINYNDTTHTYFITKKGESYIREDNHSQVFFSGMKYNNVAPSFYKRILLFIQVWSNSNRLNQRYMPIIEDIQTENFIKNLYRQRKTYVKLDLTHLFVELKDILRKIPEQNALMYVERLTGYKHYGLSVDQLALKNKVDNHTVELTLTSINHQILSVVSEHHKEYKTLYLLIEDLISKSHLTISASKTYELFNQNKNLQEIAQIRDLKLNTIYDHVIEIALYDSDFDIRRFVSLHISNEIINYVETNKTFKLKDIKDNINKEISYFQIRLVLSTMYTKERGVNNQFRR